MFNHKFFASLSIAALLAACTPRSQLTSKNNSAELVRSGPPKGQNQYTYFIAQTVLSKKFEEPSTQCWYAITSDLALSTRNQVSSGLRNGKFKLSKVTSHRVAAVDMQTVIDFPQFILEKGYITVITSMMPALTTAVLPFEVFFPGVSLVTNVTSGILLGALAVPLSVYAGKEAKEFQKEIAAFQASDDEIFDLDVIKAKSFKSFLEESASYAKTRKSAECEYPSI